MKDPVASRLRELGRLKASPSLKAAVLASVITEQAKRIRRIARCDEGFPRIRPGARGRELPEPEPVGFAPLPEHAQPRLERLYRYESAG